MANKNILLLEPAYRNKYPPLGLMKIAQYHGPRGKNDNVKFVKGEDYSAVAGVAWDRVYITTLFTFEFNRIKRTIDFALDVVNQQADKIFVGGIAASLINEEFYKVPEWSGIRFIQGLLDKSPAESLNLDSFYEELYSEDTTSTPIENLTPDYSILEHIEYEYPVHDAYFLYASRGCIRSCTFCGVPKLEGMQRDTGSLVQQVQNISHLYGEKKDLTLMDNNIVASPNFKEIISQIIDLGFHRGAELERNGRKYERRVDFNQGVDARILCKDPMYLKEISKINIKPLRIAFDHIGLKKQYLKSIRYAHEYGITNLSNYMLYNFHDTPLDLYSRLRINIDLNQELGIRIFSFPMRYQPIFLKDRSHVGEKWNAYFLRSFQLILQATHGVVSGSPSFFGKAFGQTAEQFEKLLISPHHFIFNRDWYGQYGGLSELESFNVKLKKLSQAEKNELLEILSQDFKPSLETVDKISRPRLRDILTHYVPPSREDESQIWERSKILRKERNYESESIPVDEFIEDAGLEL
jgi:hypothetical protein